MPASRKSKSVRRPARKARPKVTPRHRAKAPRRASGRPDESRAVTVVPYLTVEGASAAIAFYTDSFGARELRRELTPDGKILHCSLKIGNAVVMVAEEFPGSSAVAPSRSGATTVTIHLNVADVDGPFGRAIAGGATAIMPPTDMFWGDRYGMLKDPFGHLWSLSKPTKMSPAEMATKRAEVMKRFAPEPSSGA